ncbi:DoxX family protein [Phenylobacterium sp.]|uniref:DoxX family protein n=1 Tax=Phenylobacterium sp. TaxID=1871053 RepID=UPI003BAC0FBE
MSAETTSKAMVWTGRVLTGLFAAFMVMDTGIKLVRLPVVAQTLTQLGYPPEQGLAIGIIEAVCLALYLWPRTAVLGAILFTAVMGGAIASHMRLNDPLVSHTLFGVWLGLVMWGGLWLRDARLRTMIPLRRP